MTAGPRGEPRCHRCGRIRRSSELVVVARSKVATIRRCRNEQECDDYMEQKEASK